MNEFETSKRLSALIERAKNHTISSEELEKQRVSFVYGTLGRDSGATREVIERVIARQEGKVSS